MPPTTWPTIRENILEEIKTLFEGIVANGLYITTIKKVSRDLLTPSQLGDSDFPALFITAEREALEHTTYRKVHSELRIVVTGYARATSSGEVSQTLLDQLIHDVKVSLYQDQTRSGLAVNTFVGPEIRIDKGTTPPLAKVEIDVMVSYRNEFGKP